MLGNGTFPLCEMPVWRSVRYKSRGTGHEVEVDLVVIGGILTAPCCIMISHPDWVPLKDPQSTTRLLSLAGIPEAQ